MTPALPFGKPREKNCPPCGATFVCGPIDGRAGCWCDALPPLTTIEPEVGCFCPACLRKAVALQNGLDPGT